MDSSELPLFEISKSFLMAVLNVPYHYISSLCTSLIKKDVQHSNNHMIQ